MAIKPVEEIPKSKRGTQREQIRADIYEALVHGVKAFEFIGDYNYRYLRGYAKEEAARIRRKKVFDIQHRFTQENLTEAERKTFFVSFRSPSAYENLWLKISSCKGEHQPRVFCEVLPVEELEDAVLDDCVKSLERARARGQERSREQ